MEAQTAFKTPRNPLRTRTAPNSVKKAQLTIPESPMLSTRERGELRREMRAVYELAQEEQLAMQREREAIAAQHRAERAAARHYVAQRRALTGMCVYPCMRLSNLSLTLTLSLDSARVTSFGDKNARRNPRRSLCRIGRARRSCFRRIK